MLMTAISIKQPWAEAILTLGKDVENRSWPCPEKHLNRTILIHAGKSPDKAAFSHPLLRPLAGKVVQAGGIVGAFTIIASQNVHPASIWAEAGCYHWIIRHASPVQFFPCNGSLGFFQVDYPHSVSQHVESRP